MYDAMSGTSGAPIRPPHPFGRHEAKDLEADGTTPLMKPKKMWNHFLGDKARVHADILQAKDLGGKEIQEAKMENK